MSIEMPILLATEPAPSLLDATHLRVDIARSIAEIEAIKARWLALSKRLRVNAPHAVFDLYLAVLDLLGNAEPYVAIFNEGRTDRAMIIGRIVNRKTSCKFGYLHLPSPTLRTLEIIDDGVLCEHADRIDNAVLEHLRQLLTTGSVDAIVIEHLPAQHALFERLSALAAPAEAALHWKLQLAESFDTLAKGFSSKHRGTLRKKEKRFCQHFGDGLIERKFLTVESLGEFLRGAGGIVEKTYQAALGIGVADNPRWRAILGVEAKHDRFIAWWLEHKGVPIVFQAGAIWDDTYRLLATSFLPEYRDLSPGIVLHMRVLAQLCEAKIRTVDYGFGDADYKRTYGTNSIEEKTLQIFGKRPRARVARAMFGFSTFATSTGKAIAERAGVLRWIKRRWRSRLAHQ